MLILHAIWTNGALHLWGERDDHTGSAEGSEARNSDRDVTPGEPTGARVAVDIDTLRRGVGDVFDSLLISGAAASQLSLRLPHHDGRFVSSCEALRAAILAPSGPEPTAPRVVLESVDVPALVLAPADAVDLLTSSTTLPRDEVVPSDSFRYWSRVAGFVLELLAAQRFVPSLHHTGGDRYRGYWRVVVSDQRTSDRLGKLISAMPPVCRAAVSEKEVVQASTLVESFLWITVDSLARRCLEGDEWAHAILERPEPTCDLQMRWLRSLVCQDPLLGGPSEDRPAVFGKVLTWLSRLEPASERRSSRTCFHLHAPSESDEPSKERSWLLSLHAQSTQDRGVIVAAAELMGSGGMDDPRILQRPFDYALGQLRGDLLQASRHFPPLAPCAEAGGPVECRLTLAEAYSFLREAAPLLELEGFGVSVPKWWRDDRPRMRMWLDLHPQDSTVPHGMSPLGLDAVVGFEWRLAVGDKNISLAELSELASVQGPLVKIHERWTEVQPSEVQAALRFLRKNQGGKMTVFEALRQTYVADDLDTGMPVAGLRAHGWIENLLGSTDRHQVLEELPPPKGFQGVLRPYQLRGLQWLSFLSKLGLGACLADDMGLGKTIQLIALLLHERETGSDPGPTLLVVPMSLVGNWQREIERFAPTLRAMVHHGTERLSGREFVDEVARHDVVISTYGLIHRDREHLADVDWFRIALDEAQNIKNPAAKQAQAIRSLRSVHRVALTGTPVENRLSELWSIMDFLNVDHLGTAAEFRRRFAVPIERHHDADRAGRLRHLISPFILRRLKNDPKVEVDLPEKMEMKVYCNLTSEQAALYQSLVDTMMGQIDRAAGIQRRGMILATLVKLKQVCNHPAHYFGDGSSLPHRSGKCDRIAEMIEEVLAEGDRALIFTQFSRMGELLKKMLIDLTGREVLFLHGATTRHRRDEMVQRFQDEGDDVPLLILSLKAGGYGLNLTAASHVFHFDRWWNPAVEDQATDRAHRIGQDKRVQVHKFVCIGTLEERIDSLLDQKRDLADNIVGGGEEWLTELSTDKLREMFQLSREAVGEEEEPRRKPPALKTPGG